MAENVTFQLHFQKCCSILMPLLLSDEASQLHHWCLVFQTAKKVLVTSSAILDTQSCVCEMGSL